MYWLLFIGYLMWVFPIWLEALDDLHSLRDHPYKF